MYLCCVCPAMSKSKNKISFRSKKKLSIVSFVKSALILLPFLIVALQDSGNRKAIFWLVTAYNKYVSSQFDCSASNRISAGLKVDYSNLILKEKNR